MKCTDNCERAGTTYCSACHPVQNDCYKERIKNMRLIDADNLLTVTEIREDGTEYTYVPYSEIEHAEVYETNEELQDSLEELRKDYDRMESFLKGEIEALSKGLKLPLSCDETKEIRTILNIIHQMIEEARETNDCGNGNELSHLVSRYLPNVEQSYKNFIERSTK